MTETVSTPTLTLLFEVYLALINMFSLIVFGIDKYKAKRGKWRIPESSLLGLAVIGGSLGAWVGMNVWRHKTLHAKFKYGIPLILLIQLILAWIVK